MLIYQNGGLLKNMERKQKTKQEKYERWASLTACVSMALGIGIIPLGVGFFHGIHVIEEKPSVFWGFFAALIGWCALGSLVVILLRKKGKQLEKAADIKMSKEVRDPILKELIEAYEQDRLELLLIDSFFRDWRLYTEDVNVNDNGETILTLGFMKKRHEIMFEITEKEASIFVDEEERADREPTILPMENYKTLDELLRAVTDVCQKELAKD